MKEFWLYGPPLSIVSIGAWLFAFFLVPETKQAKPLEQIEAHWRAGVAGVCPRDGSLAPGAGQAIVGG
jgi:hypothetical protein